MSCVRAGFVSDLFTDQCDACDAPLQALPGARACLAGTYPTLDPADCTRVTGCSACTSSAATTNGLFYFALDPLTQLSAFFAEPFACLVQGCRPATVAGQYLAGCANASAGTLRACTTLSVW